MGSSDFRAYPFADDSYPGEMIERIDLEGCEWGCGHCAACGYILGAAALTGLIGMAYAIATNGPKLIVHRDLKPEKPRTPSRREARALTREWAYFARSIRRHARARPAGELAMWRGYERECVGLALKYRRMSRGSAW